MSEHQECDFSDNEGDKEANFDYSDRSQLINKNVENIEEEDENRESCSSSSKRKERSVGARFFSFSFFFNKLYSAQALMQKKVSSQRLEWCSNWFPPFWLSFLILGMPCENSAYRSKLIMSGAVSKLADDPHARLKERGNKQSRRQAKKAGGGVEGKNNAGEELSMTGSSAARLDY